jgi:hypothetical protein
LLNDNHVALWGHSAELVEINCNHFTVVVGFRVVNVVIQLAVVLRVDLALGVGNQNHDDVEIVEISILFH